MRDTLGRHVERLDNQASVRCESLEGAGDTRERDVRGAWCVVQGGVTICSWLSSLLRREIHRGRAGLPVMLLVAWHMGCWVLLISAAQVTNDDGTPVRVARGSAHNATFNTIETDALLPVVFVEVVLSVVASPIAHVLANF